MPVIVTGLAIVTFSLYVPVLTFTVQPLAPEASMPRCTPAVEVVT